jgi:subtilisin family serine protease
MAFPDLAVGSPTAQDTYFSAHGPERVSIALDRIGILVRDGVFAESLMTYADSLGLGVGVGGRDTLNTFIFTFKLGQTMTREELVAFARRVKQGRPTLIADAGMTVSIRGGKTPLLVTDRFIAQFRTGTTLAQINNFNANHAVREIEANVLKPNHYLLEVTDRSKGDALTMANLYSRSNLVRYAHPNFIHVLRYRALPWHLENNGQGDGDPPLPGTQGTKDADIDAPLAWEVVRRAAGNLVTIAVMDGGYDLEHPDLRDNLWVNQSEAAQGPNGNDEDGNGFIDDIHGYDFFPCDAAIGNAGPCGDGDPSVNLDASAGGWEYLSDLHGTPVAGLAGAVMDNQNGVAGTCPTARLMLIRRGFGEEHLALAFYYAQRNGARIISCSWGDAGEGTDTPTLNEAIDDAVSRGTTVLFAMDYAKAWNNCERDASWDLAERPNVITVGGSTNWDRRLSDAACGDYVDLLGPSSRGSLELGFGFKGTLNIATTDTRGELGYNNLDRILLPGCPTRTESPGLDYTRCFSGTSAATPIVAGVAGMVLSVNPDLTPVQVQRLLQDTADKIEPSEAGYDDQTGFSRPISQPASTHGYGRVNAFEAVRVAAPTNAGGRAGVDIFLRDNRLDWGNTEQPSNTTFEQTRGYEPYWHSMDIKIDAGPDFQPSPNSSSAPSIAFDALADEDPVAGVTNRIYVRVRNRGPREANGVKAKLYWAYSGLAAPALPADFWSGFETNTFASSEWTFIGERGLAASLPTSGSTAAKEARGAGATRPNDGAAILSFDDWAGPQASPGSNVRTGVDHFCLLAIVDSPDDHVSPYKNLLGGQTTLGASDFLVDALAPSDNNVALRNFQHVNSTIPFEYAFYMRNPTPNRILSYFKVIAPNGWTSSSGDELEGRPAPLDPGQKVLVSLRICAPPGGNDEIKVLQYVDQSETPIGGLTIRVGSVRSGSPSWCCWVALILAILLIILGVVVAVLLFGP